MSAMVQKINDVLELHDKLLTFVIMRKFYSFLFLVAAYTAHTNAQYVRIGDGSFLSNIAGPFTASVGLAKYNSRFAYIYPKTVLGNLKNGDSITSIEFRRSVGNLLNTSCNVKMYVGNTSLYDFGSGSLDWSNTISNAKLVYNQNPTDIGAEEGFHTMPFSSAYVFDSTVGENLLLLVEYTQTAVQSANVFFYFESGTTVSGFAANQSKYSRDTVLQNSLTASAEYHPTIIINYPRKDRELAVLGVYSLGKMPVPLGNPDSVRVLLRNVGKLDVSNANVRTWMQGANKGEDSVKVSLNKNKQAFFSIPSLQPTKKGLDSVYAGITGNFGNSKAFSLRLHNENIYSYRDVSQSPAPGGIGFNGSTGDFVARFYANSSKSLNQITVNFGIGGRPFRIGIWEQSTSGVKPGKLIYISDSLTSVGGNYILDLKKPVTVNGAFFVGVRQLGTNNVAFGYQVEDPVRPSTFFYAAPAGDTSWQDFAPDAPFKFLIEPRMQGDSDLTAISADYPKDSINRYTTDTMAPIGTVANIGATDLKDSFDVFCEIRVFGKLVYKEKMSDTLSSGRRKTYTFPKKFYPKDFGEHEVLIYTTLKSDQIKDNDTARRKFYVGVKKDVMVTTVYDPPNNATYEYLKDTFMPTATVQNPGYDNSTSFVARCVIYKGNKEIYNKSQTLSLLKFNSRILTWPTYLCVDTGKLKVQFTVTMNGDASRINDTITRNVYVYKPYDLGIDSSLLPTQNLFYTPGISFKPIFRIYNDGILDATDVKVACRISSIYTNQVYIDTVKINVDAKKSVQAQLSKLFKPSVKGLYTLRLKSIFPLDLVQFNDSFKQDFYVGFPYDYLSNKVLTPLPSDTLAVGSGPFAPKLRITNNGFVKNADLAPVIFQIWNGNQKVYQDIKSLNLDTGKTFDLTFANTFYPLYAGQNKIIAYTNYAGDVNRKNDTALGSLWVTVGKDAFVKSIDTPISSVNYVARVSQIPVRVTISNAGKLKMQEIKITADIFYHGLKVHTDVLNDSLNSKSEKTILFNKTFIPKDSGIYTLRVHTFSTSDENFFNDTSYATFSVIKKIDAAVINWLEPAPGSVILHTSGSKIPGVEIQQKGMDTAANSGGKVYFYIQDANKNFMFTDSNIFSGLKIGNTKSVLANKPWDFNVPGKYTATAIVNSGDKYPENDTLTSNFEVQFNGINTQKIPVLGIYPNPSSTSIVVTGVAKIESVLAIDAVGKTIALPMTGVNNFQISQLSSGIYTLVIQGANARYSLRFVRE